jgi:thiamine kinase
MAQRTANQLIATWPTWPFDLSREPEVVGVLKSETNAVYKLTSDAGPLVLRVNNPRSTQLGIDRECESTVLVAIADATFAIPVIFNRPDDGYQVSTFAGGAHPDSPHADQIRAMGTALAELHGRRAPVTIVEPSRQIEHYWHRLPLPLTKRLAHIRAGAQALHWTPLTTSLCHFDLLPPNLLLQPDAYGGWRLVILDWEFAALGDPLFDLATLVDGLNLGRDDVEVLLGAYANAEAGHDAIAKARVTSRFLALLWRLTRDTDYNPTNSVEALERLLSQLKSD